MATRKLELVFTGDTRALDRAFRRVESSSKGVGAAASKSAIGIGKMTAAAAAAGTVLVGAFAVKGVQAASDLGEQVSKTGVVFKDSANEVLAFSKTTASSLGISQRAALEATGTFGNMLVPMGLARDRAADMSTRMVALAGDMASFNNASPEEVLEALRSGLAGESEPLRKFGVFLSDARLKQEALNQGLYSGKGNLDAAAKAQATYALILKDTKDAQGDFGRTLGGSLPNQMRVAKAQFEELSASVGQAFLPLATAALAKTNEFVQSFRQKWPEIKPIVERVMNAVGNAVRAVAGWIRENWPQIRETTIQVFRAVRRAIQQAIDWIQANVVPTIRAVVAGARRFWDRFGDDVLTVMRFMQRTIGRALETVKAIVETVMAVIRGDWGAAWKGIKTILSNTLGQLADSLRTGLKLLVSIGGKLVAELVRGIVSGLKSLGGKIRAGVVGAFKLQVGIPAYLLNKGKEWGKKLIDGIVDAIKSAPSAIGDALKSVLPDPGGGVPFIDGIATGGWVGGTWTGRDNVFARLATGEAVLNPRQQGMIPGGRSTLDRIFRSTGGRMGGDGYASGGYVEQARARAVSNLGEPYGKPSRGQSRTGPGSWDCSGYATMIAGVNVGGTTSSAYGASSPARDHSRYPIVWGFRKTHSGSYRGGYDEHMGVRVGGTWFQTSGGRTAQTGADGDWQEIRVPRGLESLAGMDGDGPGGEGARGNPSLTPLQKITRILGRSGLVKDNTKAAGALGRAILRATGDATSSISDSLSGSSFSDRESRAAGAAGRSARRKARAAGLSPDEVQAAGDDAERKAEAKFLRQHVRKIDTARRKLNAQKRMLLQKLARLRTAKASRPGAKKAAARQIRAAIRAINAELSELLGLRAEAMAALDELAEQAEADAYSASYDDAGGEEQPEPATEDDYLDAALAQAGLTEGLGDDLAAAQAIEAKAGRDYQAALATGDPRLIAQAARDLLAARQQREQIQATIENTEALNANTDAMKQTFGGSVAFSSRGQSYVLGLPSSDRLESATLGV